MSPNTNISDEIKYSIEEILTQNGLESIANINYGQGAIEGFNSKTFTVDASDGKNSLQLFCKAAFEHDQQNEFIMNEILYYNSIYPAYRLFLKEKGVEDGFRNVPKCYGIRGELIILENLKHKSYDIFKKGQVMNEDHILQTFKTFAKFHAISFAMKDQKKELYNTFTRNISCSFGEKMKTAGYDKILSYSLQEFLTSLDPVEDKNIFQDSSSTLVENVVDIVFNAEKCSNDYSIITQGDSWCNNIMYLYNQESHEIPADIMLVDWQMIRNGSPTLDLSLFFYPVSSGGTIENIGYYLNVYYEELCTRIKQLGSVPELLYPYDAFQEEWKSFAKYGFGMSVLVIKTLLMEENEIPDADDTEKDQSELLKSRKENQYNNRMKMILKHLIKHDLL